MRGVFFWPINIKKVGGKKMDGLKKQGNLRYWKCRVCNEIYRIILRSLVLNEKCENVGICKKCYEKLLGEGRKSL